MTHSIAHYMKYLCIALVAGMMVTGGPSLARSGTTELAVLDDVLGLVDNSGAVFAGTRYCGPDASGCTWDDNGKPGKNGSPPGTCKSKSGCADEGKGKGGKDCKCCKTYKDGDGKTQDCPKEEGSPSLGGLVFE